MLALRFSHLATVFTIALVAFSLQSRAELMTRPATDSLLIPDKLNQSPFDADAITPWTSKNDSGGTLSSKKAQPGHAFATNVDDQFEVTFLLVDSPMNRQIIRQISPAIGRETMINRFDRTLISTRSAVSQSWMLQNDVFMASSKAPSIEILDRQAIPRKYRPTLDNIAINLPRRSRNLGTPGSPGATSPLTGLSTTATPGRR